MSRNKRRKIFPLSVFPMHYLKCVKLWTFTKNVNKAKYLCMGEDVSDLKIGNNKRVENCKQYRYLRIEIENNCCNNAETKDRITQGRK